MKKIFVTKPFLPPLNEYSELLEKIWESRVLTNGGVYHQDLEKRLAKHLGVKYVSLFTNGTIALLTALQASGINGEVITTPYSFVATSHALLWNKLKPVFVDIDRSTFNIDIDKIESSITPSTSAILAVHCYGNPVDTRQIQKIADKYNLKVIYDAAHAFGVEVNGRSILGEGDLSVLSFHATKVFNTIEGGAIICNDAEMKLRLDKLKNFGFASEVEVVDVGVNGKMSELNAALGLLQLKYIDQVITRRKEVSDLYREKLKEIRGVEVMTLSEGVKYNYSYFPIVINSNYKISRDALYDKFLKLGIYTRRYFYPLITDFNMYKNKYLIGEQFPVAKDISERVLCLPIYPDISNEDVNTICNIIRMWDE